MHEGAAETTKSQESKPCCRAALDCRVQGVSQNKEYLFGGSHHEDYSFLGSKLQSPYLGKLQHSLGQSVCALSRNTRLVPTTQQVQSCREQGLLERSSIPACYTL